MQDGRALLDAIARGDSAALTRLFESGVDPGATDGDRCPIVLHAADTGEIELVRPFLDCGLPVDAEDDVLGTTPLSAAVRIGRLPLVEFLITRGADVNRSERGEVETGTVLTHACLLAESAALVSMLLRAGADPDLPRPDGWTPMMCAAHRGNIEVVRALLAAGASVLPSVDEGKVNALSLAERRGHDGTAQLLRDHGATSHRADRLARSTSDIAVWLAEHARPAHKESITRHGPPDPEDVAELDACAASLTETVSDIAGWLAEHARPAYARLAAARGAADPAAVADLEAAVGERLPDEFRAYLRLFGDSGGLDIFEYAGLSVKDMLGTWRSLESLREDGTFDGWAPVELDPDDPYLRYTWWHPGWIPFAADGGGNLWCIDLAPAARGARGQLFSWEIHGGPSGLKAWYFDDYLHNYRDELLSGRYVYDSDSGTFD
ncbi:ankyrin repeat domain-containing protein [Spirillospora sp. NBC_01491]|uniref:ankyrin repeat domain-containing protein n=1 Tax=Spirillospora sp. NBC_01491 TaxID=2976007 RepID=UPI002E30911F|nr:ankyrin repeat domain-containing protein [Spirillospora sp. NBC_01491]